MRPVTDNTKAGQTLCTSALSLYNGIFVAMVVAKFSQLLCKIASMGEFKKVGSAHTRKTKKAQKRFLINTIRDKSNLLKTC